MSNQFQKQAAEIENQEQVAMTEPKLVEEQPLLNQFSFYGEDLQLGTHVPLHTHSYHLQPTHPNLQDSELYNPNPSVSTYSVTCMVHYW